MKNLSVMVGAERGKCKSTSEACRSLKWHPPLIFPGDEKSSIERLIEPLDEHDDACCGLCGRWISSTARSSRHYLTPKLKSGMQVETVRLHQVCHNAIHAHSSEPEALREDIALALFLSWIRKKPADFHISTRRAAFKRGAGRGRMA